jgi:hypothetical protein
LVAVLKVGRFGAKSHAHYISRRYNPSSAMSTLAASILADREQNGLGHLDEPSIREWTRDNIYRVNFLVNEELGIAVLRLLEAFLECRLKPRYERFKR